MANGITNISANYQASASYQSVSSTVKETKNGTETTLSSFYESLDVSASYSLELESSNTAKPSFEDSKKISAMKRDLNSHIDALKEMVLKLLDRQSGISSVATDNLHKLVNRLTQSGGIDELAKSEAQALISEDGYWGVNQTSQRILDFAKAISGGDASKIDRLRDAFQKGYEAAEKLWGGQLPDISKQTYDKVMEGFDEWAASSTAAAADAE